MLIPLDGITPNSYFFLLFFFGKLSEDLLHTEMETRQCQRKKQKCYVCMSPKGTFRPIFSLFLCSVNWGFCGSGEVNWHLTKNIYRKNEQFLEHMVKVSNFNAVQTDWCFHTASVFLRVNKERFMNRNFKWFALSSLAVCHWWGIISGSFMQLSSCYHKEKHTVKIKHITTCTCTITKN